MLTLLARRIAVVLLVVAVPGSTVLASQASCCGSGIRAAEGRGCCCSHRVRAAEGSECCQRAAERRSCCAESEPETMEAPVSLDLVVTSKFSDQFSSGGCRCKARQPLAAVTDKRAWIDMRSKPLVAGPVQVCRIDFALQQAIDRPIAYEMEAKVGRSLQKLLCRWTV